MEWIVLFLIGLVYFASAYLSYHEECRKQWWFWPVGLTIGTILTVGWYGMVQYLNDKHRIYVYALCWDALLCAIFYITPLFIFGVKLDKWSGIGLLLMIIGLAIIKVRA